MPKSKQKDGNLKLQRQDLEISSSSSTDLSFESRNRPLIREDSHRHFHKNNKHSYRKPSLKLNLISETSTSSIFPNEIPHERKCNERKSLLAMKNSINIEKRYSRNNELKLHYSIVEIGVNNTDLKDDKTNQEKNTNSKDRWDKVEDETEVTIENSAVKFYKTTQTSVTSPLHSFGKTITKTYENDKLHTLIDLTSKSSGLWVSFTNNDLKSVKVEILNNYLNSRIELEDLSIRDETFQTFHHHPLTLSELDLLADIQSEESDEIINERLESFFSSQAMFSYFKFEDKINKRYRKVYSTEIDDAAEEKRDMITQNIMKSVLQNPICEIIVYNITYNICFEIQDNIHFPYSFYRSLMLKRIKRKSKQFQCFKIYTCNKSNNLNTKHLPVIPTNGWAKPICIYSSNKSFVKYKNPK